MSTQQTTVPLRATCHIEEAYSVCRIFFWGEQDTQGYVVDQEPELQRRFTLVT